jgi:hypothetical protein
MMRENENPSRTPFEFWPSSVFTTFSLSVFPEIVLPSNPPMIGSCLVSLPLGSTRLFGSYGFGLSSPAISGSEGVVPPEIGQNSGPQPPASFLSPPANDPALRLDSLSHSVSLLISPHLCSSSSEFSESKEVNGLPGSCSGNSVGNRVMFGFKVSTRLIIGSGSC